VNESKYPEVTGSPASFLVLRSWCCVPGAAFLALRYLVVVVRRALAWCDQWQH
jgi:hypothetical protein